MIERWETLAKRVKQAQAAVPLHRMLAATRTDIKDIHDRLFNYEIVLEPHLLDDRINRIVVSCFFRIIHIYMYISLHMYVICMLC